MNDATADRLDRLEQELTDLRLAMGSQVRTREIVVVDEAGVPRIRLSATAGDEAVPSTCRIMLLDADGFERVSVSALPGIGAVSIAGRTEQEQRSHVDVFALDPEDGDGVYLGVELVDRGNSVGGHTVYEEREPRSWARMP
jgi:hypothetical protein